MFRKPFLLAVTCSLVGLAADTSSSFEGFDWFAQQVLKDFKAVGFAVAVIQDGKVAYAKDFGLPPQMHRLAVSLTAPAYVAKGR